MTTQHTDNEYSDADAAAARDVSTSENEISTDSASPEATQPVAQEAVAHTEDAETSLPTASSQATTDETTHPVSEASQAADSTPVAANDPSEDVAQATPGATVEAPEAPALSQKNETTGVASNASITGSEAAASLPFAQSSDPAEISTTPNAQDTPEQIPAEDESAALFPPLIGEEATLAPAFALEEQTQHIYVAESSIEVSSEDVQPFDFIAKFRQAEAALQATLRDAQAETLGVVSPVADEATSTHNQSSTADVSPVEPAQTISSPAVTDEQSLATKEESDKKKAEEKEDLEKKNAARPVSPLLRPATRLRMPRHGVVNRHQREELPAVETPQQQVQQQQPKSEPSSTSTTDAAAEQTSPKPARRYRFDRPASHTSSPLFPTTSAPSVSSAPAGTSLPAEEQKASVDLTNPTREDVTQPKEVVSQEAERPSITGLDSVRKRHGQKESQTTTSVATPAAATANPVEEPAPITSTATEVAPEDLPPLEYAELQKATSRRRRRHRSAPTGNVNAPVANVSSPLPANNDSVTPVVEQPSVAPSVATAPIAPVAPKQTTPFQPAQPAASQRIAETNGNASYSLLSGYTVNQMNQGNEASGPFMAPEPSPARGSVITRDGRTARAEMRPAPGSLYTSSPRTGDNGFSSASMTQFANIVAQALQTQTDRLVSEFRHNNQSPANVSVSLPAFPSTERVGVFVDVANLIYSARTLRMGVDFGKLLDFLRGNRRLVRAQAYCPTSPQAGDEQMFLQAVKGLGYRITTKNYKTFSSGAKKADLDLDLCMDVVRLVDGKAVDCVVLVSGDSDFMPMLDYCFDHGVRVEVAAFDEAASATIRQGCDLFINLSMLDEIRA